MRNRKKNLKWEEIWKRTLKIGSSQTINDQICVENIQNNLKANDNINNKVKAR